jgi:hypothetical protein
MKKISIPFWGCLQIISLVMAVFVIGFINPVMGQSDEAKTDSTNAVKEEAPEKASLRISFDAFKVNDDVDLKARLLTKVQGRFEPVPGVEVSFYRGEIAPGNLAGKSISNSHGIAMFTVKGVEKAEGPQTFMVQVSGNPRFDDADNDVTVTPSKMEMNLEDVDSTWTVNVFLGAPNEANEIMPVADASCQLYVKRLFGYLPVGESATTDEEGKVSFEFPKGIPGDESGMVTVVARFSDNDVVGNVETRQVSPWGVPTKKDDFYAKRELWSARANSPIPLVIVVNAILIGVWGVILFIFLEIFRINKLGKAR